MTSYERIILTSDSNEFEVTEFTLPDPLEWTVSEISAQMDVYINQTHLVYQAAIMQGYSIVISGNKIQTNQTWPAGSIFEVKRTIT